MTDRKFTEDELVELLRVYVERMCGKCNVKDLGKCCNSCFLLPISQAADLIERQAEEIEVQDQAIINALHYIRGVRVEAIKEFAERLKEKRGHDFPFTRTVFVEDIDDLVKEMTEDAK